MNLIQLVLLGDQPIFLAKTCHINIVTMHDLCRILSMNRSGFSFKYCTAVFLIAR